MNLWRIILRSLRQHAFSSVLAVCGIGAGVALLLAVTSLREQTHRQFLQDGTGVDAVLGPKGSSLQVVLNAVYHLEEMPGKIPWPYYEAVRHDPAVADGFPFVTGHSYAGVRVNAVDERFLTAFDYQPGRRFSFAPADGGQGRCFAAGNEAVAGAEAARALRVELGQGFNPVCGVQAGDPVHVHDRLLFVGILAPTGTPHDRAIYIPLKTFFALEGHGAEVRRMADDPTHREISGAYLKLKRIRGGAMHPGVQELQYNIGQSPQAQLVMPAQVLPRLFAIIGWVDRVLLAIGALVAVLAAFFLLASLLAALRERRRDLALLRCLGAGRRTVFGLILSEALVMVLAGGGLGWALGHGLVAVGAHLVRIETGMRLSPWFVCSADLYLFPALVLLGIGAGLWPALQAYRLSVLNNLTPVS